MSLNNINPSEGGHYIRQEDGSLIEDPAYAVVQAPEAPAPVKVTTATKPAAQLNKE